MTATRSTSTPKPSTRRTAAPKKASMKAAKRPVMTELPPQIIEARPKITVIPEETAAPINKWGHLPQTGPGEINARIIGSKLNLHPTDQGAARRLEALRSSAGKTYDHKRGEYVYQLDQLRRHGASRLDEINLLAQMHGLSLTFDADATKRVERYRRDLTRQLALIPRVVWRDDTEHGETEVTEEKSLGHAHSGWGGHDGHRIN